MFESLNTLLETIFTEFRKLGVTVFAIGIIIMALLTAFGGEDNKRSFQRGFIACLLGIIIFFLAKPIITFIKTTL